MTVLTENNEDELPQLTLEEEEAEETRILIWAKWKEGHDVPTAIALVMGDEPVEPSCNEPRPL